ncbi:MAG: ABC transporter ATP-binding protein [Chromatiaceae bacterium]|nr:ABC transporter ATP-binding protein [Chromatiaceae bacterium]
MSMAEPCSLDLHEVDVTLDEREVLRKISLSVLPGELLAVLGGARSGKSALLRTIAGLDAAAAGEIRIDNSEVTGIPSERRPVAILLQSYPLWPHMTVAANIAFALRRQRLSRAQVRERVQHELDLVGLRDFSRHRPWQLSASQQQRVALARTIAADARLILLDEPFSMQDARLRGRLLRLLKNRLQQSGTTTLFTTQDHQEALRFADRIALVDQGELQQIGTPADLLDEPRNRCVADYMGDSNLLDGEIEYAGEQPLFHTTSGIVFPLFDRAVRRSRTGTAMFRPRDLHLMGDEDGLFADLIRFSGRIGQIEFLGDTLRYGIDLDETTVWMDLSRQTSMPLHIGDQVTVGLEPARIRILED